MFFRLKLFLLFFLPFFPNFFPNKKHRNWNRPPCPILKSGGGGGAAKSGKRKKPRETKKTSKADNCHFPGKEKERKSLFFEDVKNRFLRQVPALFLLSPAPPRTSSSVIKREVRSPPLPPSLPHKNGIISKIKERGRGRAK